MKFKYILTVIAASLFSGAVYSGSAELDPPNSTVTTVRKSLIDKGYEEGMINDLFGDEYFYFPKSDSELDLSFYIVDKIIENGQYDPTDRDKLKNLASEAYMLYQDQQKEKAVSNLD